MTGGLEHRDPPRGELVVMRTGQIVSSHRTKPAAVRAAYRALKDYPGHAVEVLGCGA